MEENSSFLREEAVNSENDIWKKNEALLQKKHYIGEFTFHREGLVAFQEMLEESRAGEKDALEVFMYISPHKLSPRRYPETSTLYNLGHRITEETKCFANLKGFKRKKELELLQQINTTYESIRKSMGIPNPSLLRRTEQGNLTPIYEEQELKEADSDSDLIVDYTDQVNALYDFYESHFDPESVIDYSKRKISAWQKFLKEDINRKTGKPIVSSEKKRIKRYIRAFQKAIERNRRRLNS